MQLEDLKTADLMDEFFVASDAYFAILHSKSIYLLFGNPVYRAAKDHLQDVIDEVNRRKESQG